MKSDPTLKPASLGGSLARSGAVVFALSVLVWFVYDAQTRANRNAKAANPASQPLIGPPELTPTIAGEQAGGLPSSKVLVLDPGFLAGSKSAVIADPNMVPITLPSTKGFVLAEPQTKSPFLFSSKSMRIPSPAAEVQKPKQKPKPKTEERKSSVESKDKSKD
jgi:hypothetical protein